MSIENFTLLLRFHCNVSTKQCLHRSINTSGLHFERMVPLLCMHSPSEGTALIAYLCLLYFCVVFVLLWFMCGGYVVCGNNSLIRYIMYWFILMCVHWTKIACA